MMSLPSGWIASVPAPEILMPSYTDDPTAAGLAANGANIGAQPKTAGNPAGTIGSVPVMNLK